MENYIVENHHAILSQFRQSQMICIATHPLDDHDVNSVVKLKQKKHFNTTYLAKSQS